MKANELRVGNFVKILPEQKELIREVVEIKIDEVCLFIDEKEMVLPVPYAGIVPIKISLETIERFGFELHDYDLFDEADSLFEEGDSKCSMMTYKIKPDSFNKYWVGIDLFEEDQYCQVYSFNPLKKNDDGNLYHHFIEYVHQFQNLYFSITGNELILK